MLTRSCRLPFLAPWLLPVLIAGCGVDTRDDVSSAESDLGGNIVGGVGKLPVSPQPPIRNFFVHALGSRCLDFGGQASWAVGSAVVLYGCNGSVAQQVNVLETDLASHDVELRVQNSFCIGVRGDLVAIGQPLELQTCSGSPAQRFALDGDSILTGAMDDAGHIRRDFVIEPAGDVTGARTPLVVGIRDLNDAEYFRFRAVDGSATYPTSGFVFVSATAPRHEVALSLALQRGWGTVVEIDPSVPFTIAGDTHFIAAGTTLRGYRKYTDQGPEIVYSGSAAAAFKADRVTDVRVTGLRLRGPSGQQDLDVARTAGILMVAATPMARTHAINNLIVDHIDASNWTDAAIGIGGEQPDDSAACTTVARTDGRRYSGRVVGNFIHHNLGGYGYGVGVGHGAVLYAQGNVFYMNLDAISSDPQSETAYYAHDNFILSEAPALTWNGHNPWGSDQAFDAHGSDGSGSSTYSGGTAGSLFDIGWNTFLLMTHRNFALRGTPCLAANVHDNVATNGPLSIEAEYTPFSPLPANNAWNVSDPTADLAVGDFDGDHVDDLFVGTGQTWWFSSGGRSEWRLLNRMTETASHLRFGDFDGDGRTDVVRAIGSGLQVSWAGISAWQSLTTTPRTVPISDLAVGDFDGDHNADIFWANGTEWKYAAGGTQWTHLQWSAQRTSDLLFGDFTGDGKTDVFTVLGNQWGIVRGGGAGAFEILRPALTFYTTGLVAADFDGDGFADIGRLSGSTWQSSARGTGAFATLGNAATTAVPLSSLPVGRFDGDARADVLFWQSLHLGIASHAGSTTMTWSQQDMK